MFAVFAIAVMHMKFISSFNVRKITLFRQRFDMKATSSSESPIKTVGSIDILSSGLLLQGISRFTTDIRTVISINIKINTC